MTNHAIITLFTEKIRLENEISRLNELVGHKNEQLREISIKRNSEKLEQINEIIDLLIK